MVPGGSAGLAAEEGGRNALHVRVDIGSLEVTNTPSTPQEPIPHCLEFISCMCMLALAPWQCSTPPPP